MSFEKSGDIKSDKKLASMTAKRSDPEGVQGEREEKASPEESGAYEDFEAPKSSSDTIIEMPAIELSLVGGSSPSEPDPAPEEEQPARGAPKQNAESAREQEKRRSEEEEWASRLAAARAFGVIDSHPFLQAMPYDENQEEPSEEATSQGESPAKETLSKEAIETPVSEETLAWLGEASPAPTPGIGHGIADQIPPEEASSTLSTAHEGEPSTWEGEIEPPHALLSSQSEADLTSPDEDDAPTETASEEELAALNAANDVEAPEYESFQTEEIPPTPEADSLEEIPAALRGAEVESETTLLLEDSIEVPAGAEENPFLQPEEEFHHEAPEAPSPKEAEAGEEAVLPRPEPLLSDAEAADDEDEEEVSLLVDWSSRLPAESSKDDVQPPPVEVKSDTPKTPPPLPAATGTKPPPTPPRGTAKAPPLPPPPSVSSISGPYKAVTRGEATSKPEGSGPVKRSLAELDIPPELFESEEPKNDAGTSSSPGQAPTVQIPKVLPRGWWDTIFNEDFLRTNPAKSEAMTRKEADFIESCLAPKPGDWVLDIACGYGRHVLELAGRGYNMVGLDLSLPYLMLAAEISTRRKLNANFVHGDMRDLTFKEYFDSAYCVFTSFGYFDDETNLDVLRGINRSLKPKGRLLLELINRDFAVAACPLRGWWEGVGCVMLEETEFNYISSLLSTRRSVIFEDGRQALQETHVRLYSLHELSSILKQSGFKILEVSGGIDLRGVFFGADSTHLVVLAEKQR